MKKRTLQYVTRTYCNMCGTELSNHVIVNHGLPDEKHFCDVNWKKDDYGPSCYQKYLDILVRVRKRIQGEKRT